MLIISPLSFSESSNVRQLFSYTGRSRYNNDFLLLRFCGGGGRALEGTKQPFPTILVAVCEEGEGGRREERVQYR